MERGCSCKRDPAVTMVKMGTQMVGLVGLIDLFDGWVSQGRTPDNLEGEEILIGVKRRNYVSPTFENMYIEGIRSAYVGYYAGKVKTSRGQDKKTRNK